MRSIGQCSSPGKRERRASGVKIPTTKGKREVSPEKSVVKEAVSKACRSIPSFV
jgi:hypothetical protein